MLNDFYHLAFNPFDKNFVKESDAFVSEDHEQMCQRLEYLRAVGSIGVFTAAPGMGKTFALRCFLKNLNPNLTTIAYVPLTTISVTEFYGQICSALGLERSLRRSVMFNDLREYIRDLYRDKRRPLILAVDEAQYLDPAILRDLKILLNQEYDSKNCFALVLLGEPHLNINLQKPAHEALRQRIAVQYDFAGLSDTEMAEYLAHKLKSAGGSPDILSPAAVNAVRGICQGNPRKIDVVMTHALTIGAQIGRQVVDAELVRQAADGNLALK